VGVPHGGDWARSLDNLLAKKCHLDAPPQRGSEVPHVFMVKVLFVHSACALNNPEKQSKQQSKRRYSSSLVSTDSISFVSLQ
jgi:hypothetical protein